MKDPFALAELVPLMPPPTLDWETHPPWPLPDNLAEESMVWQRAYFILMGMKPDGSAITQTVDIGLWWGSHHTVMMVDRQLSQSGFSLSDPLITWTGAPMRTPGSEARISQAIADAKDNLKQPLFDPSLR